MTQAAVNRVAATAGKTDIAGPGITGMVGTLNKKQFRPAP